MDTSSQDVRGFVVVHGGQKRQQVPTRAVRRVEGVGLAAASASRRTMKAVRSKVLSGGECWDPRLGPVAEIESGMDLLRKQKSLSEAQSSATPSRLSALHLLGIQIMYAVN